jgi:hypothetical protein
MDNALIQAMKTKGCESLLLTLFIADAAFDPGNP